MKVTFPKDFLWGAAFSAEQTEGKTTLEGKTQWDYYYQQNPELFYHNIGPGRTNDFATDCHSNLILAKELGLNSLRVSISWAKLMPHKNLINQNAINYYVYLLRTAKDLGVELIVNMNHFDLPYWIFQNGGFQNRHNNVYFKKYINLVLKNLGPYLTKITSFNEPIVHMQFNYDGKEIHQEPTLKELYERAKNMLHAHLLLEKAVQSNPQYQHIKVGIIVNLAPAVSVENPTLEDQKAMQLFDSFHNNFFPDLLINKRISKVLKDYLISQDLYDEKELLFDDLLAEAELDFLGVNFYSPFRMQATENFAKGKTKHFFKDNFVAHQDHSKYRYNFDRGWEILPETIMHIAELIKNRYHNIPFYISENGMGVSKENKYFDPEQNQIVDNYRIAFIEEHLSVLGQAIEKYHLNCFGYHLWTFVDNWSWTNAYKNRYGLISLDLENLRRTPKASAAYFGKIVKENGFVPSMQKAESYLKKV